MSILQIRLKNCIQTILELESEMHENNAHVFDQDFVSLKSYLDRVDHMQLAEEDVRNLESVTSDFLAELEQSFAWGGKHARLLQ